MRKYVSTWHYYTKKMGAKILELAINASKTGEPIVKPMEFVFPNQGFQHVKDQFMLGNDILVTPAIEKGARKRSIISPKGQLLSERSERAHGGKTIEIDVPQERLPYF